jgi:hypothetical protein
VGGEGMKCSDCKLWKTEDCRNNPGEKDLNYAESFACFDLKEGYVPPADVQAKDIGYSKEALKARNRALATLIIGLVFIPITAYFVVGVFSYFPDESDIGICVTFMFIAFITAVASVILLFVALGFFLQFVGLKRSIKSSVRKETKEADKL